MFHDDETELIWTNFHNDISFMKYCEMLQDLLKLDVRSLSAGQNNISLLFLAKGDNNSILHKSFSWKNQQMVLVSANKRYGLLHFDFWLVRHFHTPTDLTNTWLDCSKFGKPPSLWRQLWHCYTHSKTIGIIVCIDSA